MTQRTTWTLAIVALVAVALLTSWPQTARAQTSAGSLQGRVTDHDGAAVPGAKVTATNPTTGFTRSTTTANDGSYRLLSIPAGVYDVDFEAQGFTTIHQTDVEVFISTTRTLDVTVEVAAIEETMTVTNEAPLINASPAIGTVVSQDELESLPLNGRQFANLAVLAPGTTLGYNSDPTKPGQLVVQLNGGDGRNVYYLLDGGDNMDDTIGGALQNFNLEAVQEFKIQTSQYKAEYGRSSGGVLSVVTKSGTNELKASAYEYYRDKSLNSRTETEKLSGLPKAAYSRDQYGASLGGPIVKDKIHFFATYEKLSQDTEYTVNSGGLFPTFDGLVVPNPFRDELGTAKATWDLNAKQFLQVRYGYQKNTQKYGAGPLTPPESLGTLTNKYQSTLLSHTAQIGTDKVNEALFQYSKFDNTILPDSNAPTVYYPSGFITGQNPLTPQSTHQVKYQYKDDFSWTTDLGGRQHDFKVGVNYIHEPTLEGDFSTGLTGQYFALSDAIGAPISTIQVFSGFAGDKTPIDEYSGYIQDDIRWSRLTLNVGLRYDYWDGFDLDQTSNPIWQTLATQTKYNESYLRDFQGGRGGKLSNDDNNFSPRIGFSWDTTGEGRKVLRGGVGRFYNFPYTNATILFPSLAVQSADYGVSYFFSDPNGIPGFTPGDPLPPNQLPGNAGSLPNEVASPTLATPYSDQASLGYAWQVNDWLGLNFDAVAARYRDLPFRFRINVIDPATGQPRFPQFGNFRLWYGKGEADYDALNVGVRARRKSFDLQGFYTLSRADGNVLAGADEFRLTSTLNQADSGGGHRDRSVNPLDPLCHPACFGPLYTDARHRVTLGATYHAPWALELSGVLRYHSGFPYTEFEATDTNGDGNNLDLRPGVKHVNSGRGDSFSQLDLRVSRDFLFPGKGGIELLAEMFNVFNSKNGAAPDRFGNATVFAGDPLQGEQRLLQLGARIHY